MSCLVKKKKVKNLKTHASLTYIKYNYYMIVNKYKPTSLSFWSMIFCLVGYLLKRFTKIEIADRIHVDRVKISKIRTYSKSISGFLILNGMTQTGSYMERVLNHGKSNKFFKSRFFHTRFYSTSYLCPVDGHKYFSWKSCKTLFWSLLLL